MISKNGKMALVGPPQNRAAKRTQVLHHEYKILFLKLSHEKIKNCIMVYNFLI